ncbi:gamma carbonic anhydrase family protein [Leucobacter sp. UCMA 4100]|uniref:gamma carbonic anhydrase family protein n=1 Tax=Leucobacter TaxID=55968 RepID=UPI001C24E323|nr:MULTISPECIES: gamma carbonic anhydrase family protein [Leucobacter]MDA3147349.1 gamma carbonic anhydrase family protein [Leucobacter sp. UCMA 4100]
MAHIYSFAGKTPRVHPDAWIAPTATLIGDVTIEAGASVWFGAVLRADNAPIVLGEGSNLQDNVVLHTDIDTPVHVGPGVGVGHNAILHGTTVGEGCLIGMGATLLNDSVIGEGAFVAAGALVLEGQHIEAGHLAAGVPAKDRGEMGAEMAERVRVNAEGYQELSAAYRAEGI